MKKQSRTKFSDPLIVPRVKNYLAENVDKTFVDVSEMARCLKERYREYSNRSEGAFCQVVEAAYKIVLQSYGIDEGSSNSEDDESDDLELLDDNNALNDQLMAMYKGQNKNSKKDKTGQDKTSELIDISSDEDSTTTKGAKVAKLSDQVTIELRASDNNAPHKNSTIHEAVATPAFEIKKRKSIAADGPRFPSQKRKEKEAVVEEKDEKKVTLEHMGGLGKIAEQIYELALQVRHPEVYERLGAGAARGALLHGPPGTGKTLLARAIAGSFGLPLIAAPATELVGGLSGESEKNIRDLFEKATALAPCALFIDEIDAISGNRLAAQKDMEKRVVSQLLCSLDGLEGTQVLVLAATSRPEALDPALRRAGRLELELPLGIPTRAARRDILRILVGGLAIHPSVSLDDVARLTPGYVGADLKALINKACATAVRRVFQEARERRQIEINTKPQVETNSQELQNGKGDKENPSEECTQVEGISSSDQNGDVQGNEKDKESQEALDQPIETVQEKNISISVSSPRTIERQTVVEENCSERSNEVIREEDSTKLKDLPMYLQEMETFTFEQLKSINVIMEDILEALKTTKPSAIREGFATVPDVTWDDVGSLGDVRRELQLAVLAPVKYPEQLESLGLGVPSGVLLCGPPGCGKTLLAKAVANEAGINFISVKGPELLNMYVGESERAVRTCFQRARNSSPCVIFFDEFDSLCPRRGGGDHSGASRVVNQLLTEMDGVEGRQGVFVLAASNRPDIIDPAVLRPGRLERVLFVGLPKAEERTDVLRALTRRGPSLADGVEIDGIARAAEGFTGADLAGLVRAAATEALLDFITGGAQPTQGPLQVSATHFQKALLRVRPSVSVKEQQHYDKLRLKYAAPGDQDIEMDTLEESMDTV